MKKKRKRSRITPYAKRLQEVTRIFDEYCSKGINIYPNKSDLNIANPDRDYLSELWKSLTEYHEAEQALIATNPKLCESELENHPHSYIWIRLPMPDEQPTTVSDMIASGVEDFPNTCLAGVLVAILKKQVPKGVQWNGVSIHNTQNFFRFCISGSTSLEDLRTLCEQEQQKCGL